MDSKNEKELKKVLARRVDPGKNGGGSPKIFAIASALLFFGFPGPSLRTFSPG